MQVRERWLGWNDKSRGVEIASLDLNCKEGTSWSAKDGPILQICSSEFKGNRGQYFAVRRSESTTIFEPLCTGTLAQSSADVQSRLKKTQSHFQLRANPAIAFRSTVFTRGQISNVCIQPMERISDCSRQYSRRVESLGYQKRRTKGWASISPSAT